MSQNLEWSTIQNCIDGQKSVRIFLKNGFQKVCRIKEQDKLVILVEEYKDGRKVQSIIYKDGISTITGV